MVRWQFALAASAWWTSLACTAAVGDAPTVHVPDPDVVAPAEEVTPDDVSTSTPNVDASDPPLVAPSALPTSACKALPTARELEKVDSPLDPGSGRLLIERANGTWVGLPLSHTGFDTQIVGTVAETTVTQRFDNPLTEPIDAVYTFPLPHDAAVDDYWIRAADRAVHGQIERRQDAVEAYDNAKKNGQTAGLLEQERPNVFTQSLANLPPGASLEVTIHMVQPLRPEGGTYELALPTVVGPRYVPGATTSAAGVGTGMLADTDRVPDASRISPPVLPPTISTCGDLSIEVTIDAGTKARSIASVAHAVAVERAPGVTRVRLDDTRARLNRDFVLRWRTFADDAQATLVADPEDDETGYFTLTIDPPKDDGKRAHGQEFIFLLDTSGSMAGQPMDVSKETMRRFIAAMTPADSFTVLRFSETASGLGQRLLPATKNNRRDALAYIDELSGGGGTEMIEGIRAALAMPRDHSRPRYVVLLTDGYIGNEDEIFALVDAEVGDTRIFGLGVGSSVNRHLLDGLAEMGHGSVTYADPASPTGPVVDAFMHKLRAPALENIAIDWGSLDVVDVSPEQMRVLFHGEPLVVFGRYFGGLEGSVTVRGTRDGEEVELDVPLSRAKIESFSGLASMWARARIHELSIDRLRHRHTRLAGERIDEEILELSLTHHVLTDLTAFVAIDTESRVMGSGSSRTVVQGVDLASGMAHQYVWGRVAAPIDDSAAGGSGYGSGYGSGSGAGFGGRGSRVPRVRTAKAQVSGATDRTVIQRIVRAHVGEIRGCYNRALRRDPTLQGRVAIRWVISADGTVATAVVDKNEVGDEALGKCIAKQVKTWRFPAVASGSGATLVTYPFMLRVPADDQGAEAKRPRP